MACMQEVSHCGTRLIVLPLETAYDILTQGQDIHFEQSVGRGNLLPVMACWEAG